MLVRHCYRNPVSFVTVPSHIHLHTYTFTHTPSHIHLHIYNNNNIILTILIFCLWFTNYLLERSNISSRISKANASGFLEHLEEMFTWYYIHKTFLVCLNFQHAQNGMLPVSRYLNRHVDMLTFTYIFITTFIQSCIHDSLTTITTHFTKLELIEYTEDMFLRCWLEFGSWTNVWMHEWLHEILVNKLGR